MDKMIWGFCIFNFLLKIEIEFLELLMFSTHTKVIEYKGLEKENGEKSPDSSM